MGVAISMYEDYGAPLGTPAKGTNRVVVPDLNLKTTRDPLTHYYHQDLQRPVHDISAGFPIHSVSFTRHISFKLYGTYHKIRNIRITLKQPSLENILKEGNLSASDFMFKLTNVYEDTANVNNIFGHPNGVFDGSMTPLVGTEIIYPRTSTLGPEHAASRPVSHNDSEDVWTEYLVLQAIAFPVEYTNATDAEAYKEILGNLMSTDFCTIECDEIGEI